MSSLRISSLKRSIGASLALAACLAGTILVSPRIAAGQTASLFGDIDGSWHGDGQVTGTDGRSERIRCRARYSVSPTGRNLSQSLVCASASYRFDIRSNIVASGNHVQGTWTETTRNAEGHVDGVVQGNRIETSVSGPGFTARLSLVTSEDKQDVTIMPQGTNIAHVEITLTR